MKVNNNTSYYNKFISSITDIYDNHFINEKNILERIRNEDKIIENISELDLAIDLKGQITDQNHVGGYLFVEELAQKALVHKDTYILDICSGLGGSARYLANKYGCKVLGVDISPKRCKEAENLSKLVGLSNLVNFVCGDVLEIVLPEKAFDMIWSQDSLNHILNKNLIIERSYNLLNYGGCITMEEIVLKDVASVNSYKPLKTLSFYWKSDIKSIEYWKSMIIKNKFELILEEDLSLNLINWLDNYIYIHAERKVISLYEMSGLKEALKLAQSGIIGYYRIIAKKQ